MDTRTLARIAGLAGLATVIGGTVVEVLFPVPVEPGGTAEAILRAGSQPGVFGTVTLLAATTGIGTALLLVFAAALARCLDPEYGLLAQLAVLGAFGGFLLSILRRGLTIAFVQVAGNADPGGAVALYVAAGDSLVRVYAFPIILQMGSLGILIISRRILPGWTGWAALGLATAMVVGSFVAGIDPTADFGFPVYIGILVWTAVVSVILLARPARSSPADLSERAPSTVS
ncbi:MAG: hypothetical protein ACRDGJ_00505 [Candidatus Limnocylindria bacterium]